MNMNRAQSSTLDAPLPESATTITRWRGDGSSPATTGTRIRVQTVAGPRAVQPPRAQRHSTAFA